MNTSDEPVDGPPPPGGGRTAPSGTPVAVDLSRDRRARGTWLVFLAGPITWFVHFMFVYLVAEAGCTGDGPGFDALDPPVPVVATIVATVIAVAICVAATFWGWRWWRASVRAEASADDGYSEDAESRNASLAFAGGLLSAFSVIAVLFTGAPAVVLWSC